MEDHKYALLMTACIKPPAINLQMHAIQRSNPNVRLKDYKIALKFWLTYNAPLIKSIVFVDNSGYDITDLKKLVNQNNTYKRKVEFLQFEGSQIPDGLHYGYSELEIIDYAFLNSKLIKESKFIIKVTGRLVFPAIYKLITKYNGNYDFAADSRDYKLLRYGKHYIMSTIFIVENKFYKNILYNAKERMVAMNCGLLENLYYKILKPLSLDNSNKVIIRFPFNVEPIGIGAHWEVNYLSYKKRVPSLLRAISRKLFPNLWI